jgi:hypothetical protein
MADTLVPIELPDEQHNYFKFQECPWKKESKNERPLCNDKLVHIMPKMFGGHNVKVL